jgi:hypothetical protein
LRVTPEGGPAGVSPFAGASLLGASLDSSALVLLLALAVIFATRAL